MEEARERTIKLIKSLDDFLSGFPGHLTAKQAIHMIKWINTNLDRPAFVALMKELDLENLNVIQYLMDQEELNPTRYN